MRLQNPSIQDWNSLSFGSPYHDVIPALVTEKKRSEQALIQVVHECYVSGASQRKIAGHKRRKLN
ncbi:transposase [Treponema parvum]|nr:transposase [Treponema parvum]